MAGASAVPSCGQRSSIFPREAEPESVFHEPWQSVGREVAGSLCDSFRYAGAEKSI